MRYDKLVRDLIPDIIRQDGKIPITHIAQDDEFVEALGLKLVEEAFEVFGAESRQDRIKELADVQEVMRAFCDAHGIQPEEVETMRCQRAAERGGFFLKIILDEVHDNS